MEKLVEALQQQIASQDCRYEEKQRSYEEQLQILKDLIRKRLQAGNQELSTAPTTTVETPNFPAFDSTSELQSDYWSRFCTFANAHSVPNEKSAKGFSNKSNLNHLQNVVKSGCPGTSAERHKQPNHGTNYELRKETI